jgi:hypothetical protein
MIMSGISLEFESGRESRASAQSGHAFISQNLLNKFINAIQA